MKLHIFKQTQVRVPRTSLLTLFTMITDAEANPSRVGNINLVLTTDQQMQRLNRQFRGTDRTTDVLAFNIDDPYSGDDVFGEVYISVPAALRQARQYGATNSQELLRLVCHGLLHLFGYDHHRTGDARRMKAREGRYLKQLGITVEI